MVLSSEKDAIRQFDPSRLTEMGTRPGRPRHPRCPYGHRMHKNARATSDCKTCKDIERNRNTPERRARTHLRRRLKQYGLTVEVFETLLAEQGHRCAICRCAIGVDSQLGPRYFGLPGVRKLATATSVNVDHCHETGKVRGLLCQLCNRGLGWFKDSIEALRAAADYLEHHR